MQNLNDPVKLLPVTQGKTTETGSHSTSTTTSVTADISLTIVEKQLEMPEPVTSDSSTGDDAAGNADMEHVLVISASDRHKTYNLDESTYMKTGTRANKLFMVFMVHSGSTPIMSELKDHTQIHFKPFEPVDHCDIQTNTTTGETFSRWHCLRFDHGFLTLHAAHYERPRAMRNIGTRIRNTHRVSVPSQLSSTSQ